MRKKVVSKGNVRRADYLRAVVTDTLPEEVPIIFSNDGFYSNLTNRVPHSAEAALFVETLLSPERSYTKPYRYSVLRDAWSARGLSLIHPSAQQATAEFYQKFDSLICYYGNRSEASLRAPVKVGSTFFVKGPASGRNRHRRSGVDTVTIENSVSNPASYFAYNKISRAHEFFDSNDYLHLEKKYKFFRSLDVSKCFGSIYTHTLYWAVSDVQTAKDNTNSSGFANEFDRLMQSMNYNETNGICVGPEISRIFAEIIFSEIDRRAIQSLSSRGLSFKTDYEFRRYVDDYYVFSQDEHTTDRATAAIQTCLKEFNLHLNEAKTITISRPFSTKKSRIIAETNAAVTKFFNRFLEERSDGDDTALVPKIIIRADALLRSLVNAVKAICTIHDTGYDTVSDYIVSAASRRMTELSDGYALLENYEYDKEKYVASSMMLIEVIYFFYTVNPTVRSSLNVARATITATRLYSEHFPDRLAHLSESIVRWTLDLAKSIRRNSRHEDLTAVPVEVLNILIPMREIAASEPLVNELIETMCSTVDGFDYFEIVSFLFLSGGSVQHRALIRQLFDRAKAIVAAGLGPRVDSQSAHLALDILACPYIPLPKRASWFNVLRSQCQLPRISAADARNVVSEIEAHPWFVRWATIDLLSILRKKELSAVY
ncbi:antiviral reverse transcriptase Drt3b (plasmid) [Sphingobium sp. SJ10-10]|uniref:antiviral reverse transcriptase Drt3b n=1 Tax=Sphingobium sp. SJ10-10 TaxID=3114999 RepID=UPI002E1817E3|nr:antiviral reverse transcriptase Drt3b [Sphingobium sp. SJ10-10]